MKENNLNEEKMDTNLEESYFSPSEEKLHSFEVQQIYGMSYLYSNEQF